MLPKYEQKEIKKEIKAIKSQIDSLDTFLDSTEINPQELYTQLRAVQGKVNKSLNNIFDDLLRKYLAAYIVKSLDDCPGDCEYCDNLQDTKEKFPFLKIAEVADTIVVLKKKEKKT